MPLTCFRLVIKQLQDWPGPKIKVLKLSLYGEPLIHPDFCEMLKIAKEADVSERIETTTNASLLTEQIAAKLVVYQLDYIRVSIYSPFQQKHEEITGSTIDIRKIHDNLKSLQDIKRHVGSERPFIATKMLDAYGQENDAFFKMYKDVADEVYIDKPHNWIKTGTKKFTDALYQDNCSKKMNDDIRAGTVPRISCTMPFTTMAVRSNGDVSPCCVDFIGGTNLGNVASNNLQYLWSSDAWHKFMVMQLEGRKHENASCARCDFYMSSHYTKDNIDGLDVQKLKSTPKR